MLRRMAMTFLRQCQQQSVCEPGCRRLPWLAIQSAQFCQSTREYYEDTRNTYPTLNVRVTGHDCTVVEHYAQYLHNMAQNLDIEVSDSYALPTKTVVIQTLQRPGAIKKPRDFTLKTYERVVQVNDLVSTKAPVFLELLQLNMPQGVKVKVQEHTEEHYEDRFIKRDIPEWML
ncbi:large ribosomal subunit protein mL48-like [Ptychodera flava]|uniref:large ribosomal subunit protein mL48-like n=1 Tax=Ptychodera flava TaxID=63121 RepID=UPI003969F4ED